METACIILALLLLATGRVLTADGDVGAKCASGNSCVDAGAYCDPTDSNCKCNTGFVQSGAACARVHKQVCGTSQCAPGATCIDGECTCNAALGYQVNNGLCACPTGSTLRSSDGKCEQECTASATCVDHASCSDHDNSATTPTQCTCDSSGLWQASSNKLCECNSTKAIEVDGKCIVRADQECTTTDTCVPHSSCSDTDGVETTQTQCTCDSSGHWQASTSSKLCECVSGRTEVDDKCVLLVDEVCTSSDTCVPHASCIDVDIGGNPSMRCTCDSNGHWQASTKLCVCDSSKAVEANGRCLLLADQVCTATDTCVDHASCTDHDNTATTPTQCTCDSSGHWQASSSKLCECNPATHVQVDGKCLLKAEQECTSTDTCVEHSTCTDHDKVATTKPQCTCDVSQHWIVSTTSKTCECDPSKTILVGSSCSLIIGAACTSTSGSSSCIPGAICDKLTKTCVCDTANYFASASAGAKTCTCTSNAIQVGANCLLKAGETCSTLCVSGATCKDNTTTSVVDFSCTCSGQARYDGTCSAGVVAVASWILLLFGLLVSTRPT